MLTRILRYIRGYVRIRITGYSPERFLNLCKYRKIPVWGLTPGRNCYDMNLTIDGMKKLKPILRKTGTSLRIMEKRGLPFFLFRNRKRKIFFAGAAGCVLLVYILSLFVWNIEISGNHVRTDETILAFLREQDIHCGMPASSVDCAGIARMIRRQYDDVIWVSASLTGSRIQIEIKENSDSREVEERDEETEGTDLIAEKDGVVREIITRSGVPMVHAGDEVKAGDILVSGRVEIKNDSQEVVGYQYQDADADIRMETEEPYENELDLSYTVKKYERKKKYQIFFRISNKEYTLGQKVSEGENREVFSSEVLPQFSKSFPLPFSFGIREEKRYREIRKTYAQKEYQRILSEKFERYCEDLRKKGVQILENDVKIYKDAHRAKAKGTLILLESCGKERKTEHGNLGENNADTS
nr:sporulation protein YqfD [uncultured Sellimonas sp.]